MSVAVTSMAERLLGDGASSGCRGRRFAPAGTRAHPLVSHAQCPCVRRAAIVLAERGVPFERTPVDFDCKPGGLRADTADVPTPTGDFADVSPGPVVAACPGGSDRRPGRGGSRLRRDAAAVPRTPRRAAPSGDGIPQVARIGEAPTSTSGRRLDDAFGRSVRRGPIHAHDEHSCHLHADHFAVRRSECERRARIVAMRPIRTRYGSVPRPSSRVRRHWRVRSPGARPNVARNASSVRR